MFNMLRLSLACFALTAIAFVLQLLPFPGIFLMFLGAPFWSVALINIGFAALLVEAWNEKQRRWIAVFPIAWFGGYFMAAAISHWQNYQHNKEIATSNEEVRLAFDPAKQDIVIEPEEGYSRYGNALDAGNLVRTFDLRRAYHVTPPQGKIQEYELRKVECPSGMGDGGSNGRIWHRLIDGGYGTGRPMSRARGLCLFISFRQPEQPTVRIRPLKLQESSGLANLISQNIEIRMPGSQPKILRSGWGVPLSWLPQPIMGCWLNSGAASWDCDVFFTRESLYSPSKDRIPNRADDVVAKALGLSKISIRERYSELEWK